MEFTSPIIRQIETVAMGFVDLLPNIVFVGGAVVPFYVDNPAVISFRPTEDVDCIVEVSTWVEHSRLEEKLRILGFRNDTSQGAPICRWFYKGVKVDVMPVDAKILGFSNIWYKEGMANAVAENLPNGSEIRIFSLPYFIAAKIEAFVGRGGTDYRTSHDLEDVITILDGRNDLSELFKAPAMVRGYLRGKFGIYLKDSLFLESISGNLEYSSTKGKRAARIVNELSTFVAEYD
jgi:hypothetical protein